MLLNNLPDFFKARRDQLMHAHPNSVFILPAWPHFTRNPDVEFPHRQSSDLYYLSGFEEPESCLVLAPAKSKPGSYRMALFLLPRDPDKELWEGERYGLDRAQKVFGADEVYPFQELDSKLIDLLAGAEQVFYRVGLTPDMDRRIISILDENRRRQGRTGRSVLPILDPGTPIGEMRLFKKPEELQFLREASKISARAHKAAMKECKPGMNEYEIEGIVDYVMRKEGCQRLGYYSIVAAGKNATCLHYRSNNEVMKDGDLLLIDAGGEYQYYTADITRTFPVGREFTKGQSKLYDLTLKSQKAAIAMTRPGVTLIQIHQLVCKILTEGLLSLGLLKGSTEEILKSGGYRRFYPHNTSHWLGMDVHDVGLYFKNGEPRPLEPGMVFTIEPGLYCQPSDPHVPDEYRNIGIRIEDDIHVTPDGCEVLTKDAPKEREELEALKK